MRYLTLFFIALMIGSLNCHSQVSIPASAKSVPIVAAYMINQAFALPTTPPSEPDNFLIDNIGYLFTIGGFAIAGIAGLCCCYKCIDTYRYNRRHPRDKGPSQYEGITVWEPREQREKEQREKQKALEEKKRQEAIKAGSPGSASMLNIVDETRGQSKTALNKPDDISLSSNLNLPAVNRDSVELQVPLYNRDKSETHAETEEL